MWFSEQINSFLDLGICKEYSIMARQKSISGGKTPRARKEQPAVNAPVIPDGNPIAAEAAPVSAQPEVKPIEAKPVDVKPIEVKAVEAKPVAEIRKFELHKTEPRKNVVPINIEEEIRRRAYELFQQRGPGSGSEANDWLMAEREVMQRYRQQQRA
jgi:Protein of unknown function (DUF2934)